MTTALKLFSAYADLGPVVLPEWRGRQHYMHTFDPRDPVMAEGFEDYLPVVKQMFGAVYDVPAEAHMTVDEKIVEPGMSQRRPGAHLDGHYQPEIAGWRHDEGRWNHYCNELPVPRMTIMTAASVAGCKVYPGKFEGEPKNDGDMEHIRDQLGEGVLLDPNRAYILSPDCIHESMRFDEPTKRTFLRIAFLDEVTRFVHYEHGRPA